VQKLFQIATGNSVREEITDYVVANNLQSIEEGLKAAFLNEYSYLGSFKDFKLGKANNFGQIEVNITYIDEYKDEETTQWELRTVKAFL
jgi:hypothetical protein